MANRLILLHALSLVLLPISSVAKYHHALGERPDGIASMKHDSRRQEKFLQRKVCMESHEFTTQQLIEELQCVEHHAPPGTQRVMHLVWEELIGIPYPDSVHDWKQFICSTRSFVLWKRLIDVAFLLDSQVIEMPSSDAERDVTRYSQCPGVNQTLSMLTAIRSTRFWDRNQASIASLASKFMDLIQRATGKKLFKSSGIIGNEDSFNEPTDRCDREAFNQSDVYCSQKRDHSMNRTLICVHRIPAFIKDLTDQHRCLEKRSGHQMMEHLKSCWKLVTTEDYPRDEAAIVNFNCNHKYPAAVRRIIDNCYYERLSGGYISSNRTMDVFRQLNQNLTEIENERQCAIRVWRAADVGWVNVYRTRYNKYRSRYQLQKTCIDGDARMRKGVLHDVRCPEYRLDRQMFIVLKFCWKVATGTKYPSNMDDWISLLCSSSKRQLRSIEAKINPCIRAGPGLIYGSILTSSLASQVDRELEQQLGSCSGTIPFSERDIEVEGS